MNIMKLNRLIIVALTALTLASCSDKMDYNEYNVYDADYIKKNFTYVGDLVTAIYRQIDYDFGNYSGAILGSASDESEYAISGNAIEDFYDGAWSPTNAKSSIWSSSYTGIADCNLVLSKFQGLTFDELVLNSDYDQQMYRYWNYKWEARFWRAYFYFNLVRQYGAVPLVTETMSNSEINTLSRTSADSVFNYIFSECNVVKDSIIKDYTDLGEYALSEVESGRANNLAVLALRARAALYWASPLFNTSNDKTRWLKAAQYTKELIDSCEARGMKLAPTYSNLWATDNYNNTNTTCEIIFGRRVGSTSTFESYNYPVGIEGGNGGNCPTQTLVDAYEMQKTGLGINETGSGYDASNPYTGRDPRFELTIAKNGDTWPTSYATVLQTYQNGANAEPLTGGTPTGYYLKKYCHGTINLASSSKYKVDNHTWITFRLGEFYLNMAEALYKYLGSPTATSSQFPTSAIEYINKVRARVSMPNFPTTLSNDAFWSKYTNERMVELAFEGHRFWDVRRWKEADKYFKSIQEMKLTKNDDGTITYTRKTVSRQWADKMYLFPVPQTEIMKDPNLTQNTGWE
jgi:hypothetical protein